MKKDEEFLNFQEFLKTHKELFEKMDSPIRVNIKFPDGNIKKGVMNELPIFFMPEQLIGNPKFLGFKINGQEIFIRIGEQKNLKLKFQKING